MPHPLNAFEAAHRLLPMLTLAVVVGACGAVQAADDRAPGETGPAREVVLLELFTSQGCSSCPPADRLLVDLAQEEGVAALSFHVDYWNYIGWTDPFSAEAWTRRQHAYARVLRSDSVYTPQLVIDGRAHVVGSRPRDVEGALKAARQRPAAAHLALSGLRIEGDTLHCTVAADLTRAVANPPRLLVALVQDGLTTPVSSGENRRQTLRNDRVVRKLEAVADLAAASGSRGTGEVAFRLDPEWSRENLGLVAFVQDSQTLEIYGAATAAHP
jgi:hypothetical protein